MEIQRNRKGASGCLANLEEFPDPEALTVGFMICQNSRGILLLLFLSEQNSLKNEWDIAIVRLFSADAIRLIPCSPVLIQLRVFWPHL